MRFWGWEKADKGFPVGLHAEGFFQGPVAEESELLGDLFPNPAG